MLDRRRFATGLAALVGFAPAFPNMAFAAASKLSWQNLVPPAPPLKNFTQGLPPEQQEAMDTFDFAEALAKGEMNSDIEFQLKAARKDAEETRQKFKAQGIDIDAVYAKYLKFMDELDRRGRLTNHQLNGKEVALAGYLLPLDFDPNGSKEFLLVPFVGACIHVPPPPPNQVVYIKSPQPYALSDLFEGVLVTGTMKIETTNKDLSFMDGANNVPSSYLIESHGIKRFNYIEPG